MAATDSEAPAAEVQHVSKPPDGTILPPPGVVDLINRVAPYIARGGLQFEERVRANNNNPDNVAFFKPDHPYHAYYRWRVAEIKAGRGVAGAGSEQKTDVSFRGRQVKVPEAPPEYRFSARMPNISAQDLDIVKLTAQFAAKNGKAWLTTLGRREAGNYQFDFLLPQHTLNMYFTRLLEQYKDLFEGETVDEGKPQKERVDELKRNVENRTHILEGARKRAEFIKWQQKQKVEKEEKAEAERIAFAQIDWHDFVVVDTVIFTEADESIELPRPTSLNDLQSSSLEQKAAMRIGVDMRIEEAAPDLNDYAAMHGGYQQMPAAQITPGYPQPPPTPNFDDADRARAAAQASQQPSRIRNDYVPQAQRRKVAQNTSLCPNCMQAIPNNELEEHMRIELLDPRWQEQRAKEAQRSATTNLSTVHVADNLKRLASQRTDVFDPVTGQAVSEEEHARRKRVELNAYNGVSNTGQLNAPTGNDKMDVQAQIQGIHARFGQNNG